MSDLVSCGDSNIYMSLIFRNQPVYQVEDEFLPDPISRYRHLLFAALKFCLAVLTSLGVENTEAGLQV